MQRRNKVTEAGYAISLFLLLNLIALNAFASAAIEWGYSGKKGPENWGKLTNQYIQCHTGKLQSPIDIVQPVALGNYSLLFKNASLESKAKINDLGNDEDKTIVYTGHSLQVNLLDQANEEIVFSGNPYKLIQFHFHTPSENRLNGLSFPAEIHLVHQHKQNKKIAVVAVFLKNGQENPILQIILDHAPQEKGIKHIIKHKLNPYDLLPQQKNYFNFLGSLTSPPCNEGLEWIIVMSKPLEASRKQIQQLHKIMGDNARPLQKLNQRKIIYAVEKE